MRDKKIDLKSIFKKLWQKWRKLWETVSYIITKLLLGLMFYIVFTLYRLIAKMMKKDFLDVKMGEDVRSYWKEKEKVEEEYNKLY